MHHRVGGGECCGICSAGGARSTTSAYTRFNRGSPREGMGEELCSNEPQDIIFITENKNMSHGGTLG